MAFKKIKQYLDTGDGSAGTLLIPKIIMPTLIEEHSKNLLDRSLAAMVIGPEQFQGSTFNINLETPDTMDVREVGEGAEIPLDTQDYSTVSFTPKKYGVAVRITKEMREDSQFPIFQRQIRTAGKRFAENETKLILEALDGANTTVSGGASVTIANLNSAIFNIRNQDFVPSDILVGNEVLQDLMNIDTFAEADKWGGPAAARTGMIGTVYGLNVHVFSSNAAPSTTYATSAYVLDREEAYAIAVKRDVSVENFTLPTYDMEGAVLTNRIDVKLLRSKAVSKITSS